MLYYGLAYVIAQQIETGFCEGRSCPEGEERAEQQDPELTQEPVHASGMEWRSHGNDNDDLVSKLKRNKIIKSRRVEDAMRKVDRGNYCSISPYMDSPQAIGYGVTISAPHMHAHALEMLKDHLYEGAKALDVGSGSGYLTACMAEMVGESGKVIDAPYDAIHVGAAAHPIPDALLEQLKPGGRLFIPVGPISGDQWLEQIDKDKDGNIVRQKLMGVRYVPLTDREQQHRP
ncbi:protein-L-isoaspartate(D-aspartate) O-methyltransferase-like isoform X2 [Pocillopora damicornis]|uniref:protein-L-isoaspartate(D-aspartate) O-methyltransferase-like isoform X2 n=1 Tax=Pocillopora damicornis TaxID=46731 RepID=UPI000F5520B0|nr:protein-L-isoaspartate(D-aspartate) O-methyltransferase-like isoform X2 [Pocillopora damicornis]